MHCICRLRTLLESGLCPSINLRVAYSAIMLAGCGPFYILYILLPGYITYITELQELNLSSETIEMGWLLIRNPHQRRIIIGSIYRSPQANIKNFTDTLTDTINRLAVNESSDIFILGDFNVNYADSRNPARKNLTDFEALTGLKQLITQTTRFARSNSTIDLIYSNSDNVINSGTLHINVSDHEAIFVSRKKAREKFNIIESYGRSYVNYSKNEFQEQIRNLNWDILSHSTDVNEFWGIIEDNIRNTIENMCP